jgi:putative transposase
MCYSWYRELATEPERNLSKKLERFQDVLIQDSTIVRLHSSLAKQFPAAKTRKVAAGVKVSIMISAVANESRKRRRKIICHRLRILSR